MFLVQKTSIVISFKGGLGNQMFQYAAGRYLSYLHDCGLKLDISTYNQTNFRKFGLKHFNIKGQYIKETLFSRIFYKLKLKLGIYSIYNESIPGNIKKFESLSANTILNGYWQNEKYFKPIEQIIRTDFKFKYSQTINEKFENNIIKTKSVSIHIRRGDYVSNSEVNEIHGICSMDYYKTGIDYIVSRVKDAHFFIFSDEIKWAKSNFIMNYPHTFIDIDIEQIDKHYSEERDIFELGLMSLCKHNIIANSSFSWWGAWLNKDPNKIVIAPLKWFNDESIIDASNLIPATWVRI